MSKSNETLFVSFTAPRKVIVEFKVLIEEIVRIGLDEIVGFLKLMKMLILFIYLLLFFVGGGGGDSNSIRP